MTRIALIHWGELTINAYYLAVALSAHDIVVDFYLYTPRKVYGLPFLKNLHSKVVQEFNTVEYKCSLLDSAITKLNSFSKLSGLNFSNVFVNQRLLRKTRRHLEKQVYKNIITVGQTSLYWLYKTDPASLEKTIHYSLEIQKVTDPHFITPAFAEILSWETRLLKRVKGLIIQDIFRAEALLNVATSKSTLNFFFIPVSILGNVIKKGREYLNTSLGISLEKKIILYFGAVYPERYIKELSQTLHKELNDLWVLVLHGPDNFSGMISDTRKIKISKTLLDYDDLHLIISSATIGLALYDNNWPNTRYTAFSSEKIARYLQVGVPFIAFKNESYLKLKEEFNCCFLIENIAGLALAIDSIMGNYEIYKENCYQAFDKYYNLQNTILPLASFCNSDDH